ncbi:MAG: hypothetical protein VX301_03865, partial [Pseudomonadota bacterium]|nr:hypothetical protein [Pseudomonadota bacterium]
PGSISRVFRLSSKSSAKLSLIWNPVSKYLGQLPQSRFKARCAATVPPRHQLAWVDGINALSGGAGYPEQTA